jgi:hypothetical protein
VSLRSRLLTAAALGALLVACGGDGADVATPTTEATERGTSSTTVDVPTTAGSTTSTVAPLVRPDWLGTRVLPLRPDGFGEVQPTPPELDPRQLPTIDVLPPPADGLFHASVTPVPDDVLARSTWQAACPVTLDELRYVTVSFWGFDAAAHTGELLVHRDVADAMAALFQRLFDARFPIEEMRITAPPELDAPPTGDGNNTSAFVCRPSRGSTSWSQHAYGLAVDVNPFHNPYLKDDLVLPELASTYADRSDLRPGMIVTGDAVVAAFEEIGWAWGGHWNDPVDPMHFSSNGR